MLLFGLLRMPLFWYPNLCRCISPRRPPPLEQTRRRLAGYGRPQRTPALPYLTGCVGALSRFLGESATGGADLWHMPMRVVQSVPTQPTVH